MTSEQIRKMEPMGLSEREWLKQICLQLALLNESCPVASNMQLPYQSRSKKVN